MGECPGANAHGDCFTFERLKRFIGRTAQPKIYLGGGEWYELKIDYHRIAKILADAGYTGYVSLEMEGKQNPDIAVPESIALLRKAFAA